jgi:hypothetical protein
LSVEKNSRMARETKTIEKMVLIFCRKYHAMQGTLCNECDELLRYASARLEKCPFQEGKTTCAKCPVHCYKPDMRERVRKVMRFSGPRIVYRHPLMALFHMIDGFRKKPIKRDRNPS